MDPQKPIIDDAFYPLIASSFGKEAAFHYWRKQERHALLKHSARLHKTHLQEQEKMELPVEGVQEKEASKQKSKPNPHARICVHIVEARNVAIKDDCGTSDPYCVIEYGSKQRYETNVVPKTLYPRWDQDITL